MGRSSFGKRDRDRAKKAKADAKRERRQGGSGPEGDTDDDADAGSAPEESSGPEVSTDDLLQMIEDVHRKYDAGQMTYEEFETTKADLLGRLSVD